MAAGSEGRGGLPGVTWLVGGELGWDPGTLGLISVSGCLGGCGACAFLASWGDRPRVCLPCPLRAQQPRSARVFRAVSGLTGSLRPRQGDVNVGGESTLWNRQAREPALGPQ